MIKSWPKRGTLPLKEPRIFRMFAERFESPRTGATLDATIVEGPDWVNVLALTEDDDVLLVRQFRFGTQRISLEVPGGVVDPGETPEQAARRELREETGYEAATWHSLGTVAPNPAFIRNRLHCFLARGCQRVGELRLDPFEDIEVCPMPLVEVRRGLSDGSLDHALVMAIFLRFELREQGS